MGSSNQIFLCMYFFGLGYSVHRGQFLKHNKLCRLVELKVVGESFLFCFFSLSFLLISLCVLWCLLFRVLLMHIILLLIRKKTKKKTKGNPNFIWMPHLMRTESYSLCNRVSKCIVVLLGVMSISGICYVLKRWNSFKCYPF